MTRTTPHKTALFVWRSPGSENASAIVTARRAKTTRFTSTCRTFGYRAKFLCSDAAAPPHPEKSGDRRQVHRLGKLPLFAACGLMIVAASLAAMSAMRHLGWRKLAADTRTKPLQAETAPTNELRIAAGLGETKYIDTSGHLWLPDCYYRGGVAISWPTRRIFRTPDPTLYQHAREGDFEYAIPLKPGIYEVHLHFAEIVRASTSDSDPAGQRRFDVTANGNLLLKHFDITMDTPGVDTADERIFTRLSPRADGHLHLRFASFMNPSILSGIEVLPADPKGMRPVRILAGDRSAYDASEHLWERDQFFDGGRLLLQNAFVAGTAEPQLFSSERFGAFTYHIPVASGRYALTLRFAESNFGVTNIGTPTYSPGGVGSRMFDIYCNGVALVRKLDILKEAGAPNLAIQKTFHGLVPNEQGKLVLTFSPVTDYAAVRAIEVMPETDGSVASDQK